jgi:hypothetical protein
MDDFTVSSLHESKNEWGSRLLTILTPHIVDGLKSIFDEAVKLCRENNEMEKYLMTFQNFITRIPKWNTNIIELERTRIVEKSGCGYLEDLVTCVHIIQLKLLSAIRVGQKQKKIDITIPKLDDFIHKIYIHVARKLYKNVYLFEINIPPLQTQKFHRELEMIIQECILNTIRDSIPVEAILHAYMDETIEEHISEEIKEQVIDDPNKQELQDSKPSEVISEVKEQPLENAKRQLESETYGGGQSMSASLDTDIAFPALSDEPDQSSAALSFNDIDFVRDEHNHEEEVEAPKNIGRLEEISAIRNAQRKQEEENDDDDDENVKLTISNQDIHLDSLDVHTIDFPEMRLEPDMLLDDIEVLA